MSSLVRVVNTEADDDAHHREGDHAEDQVAVLEPAVDDARQEDGTRMFGILSRLPLPLRFLLGGSRLQRPL